MSNALIRNGYGYIVAGTPYQPARPAYTSYQTFAIVNDTLSTKAGEGRWVTLSDGRVVWIGPTGKGIEAGSSATGSSYIVATVHPAVPAVPGTPAVRVEIPPRGWTAFGHSIAAIRGTGDATFSVPEAVSGVAVGLSSIALPTAGYAHIRQGLLFSMGAVRNLRTGSALGAYEDGDVFTMSVRPGGVQFRLNGDDLASEANGYAAGETLFLSAAMYAVGDQVTDPALLEVEDGTSTARFPAMRAVSGEGAVSTSVARFPAMRAASSVGSRSAAVFPGMRAFSMDHAGGTSRAAFPAMDADSYGGALVVLPNNSSVAQFAPMAAASLLLVGGTGAGTATFGRMRGLSADHPGGSSQAEFPAMQASSGEQDHGIAHVLQSFLLDFALGAGMVDKLSLLQGFVLDIELTETLAERVDLLQAFALDIDLSAGAVDTVSIFPTFVLDVPLSLPGAALEVHAVSMDGFGSTTYAGYPFTSFAKIGERYYGTAIGGLFELGGNSDAGAPIRAAICPGKLDFGTSQNKTIAEAWIGAMSEGKLACKLEAEGCEYLYCAESFSADDLEQHRIKFGKGLKANYITPIFYNEDGQDFEVDALEFAIATMSRKG